VCSLGPARLVPNPVLSISASPAVIVRLVSQGSPTILLDEVDACFGSSKAQEANADLRSILNGGYRRGAQVHRCTTKGKKIEIETLDAYSAVAVAGLRNLPDTLTSRSILIRMKRRAPDEIVEPFRYRDNACQAEPIKDALAGMVRGARRHDCRGKAGAPGWHCGSSPLRAIATSNAIALDAAWCG
jgi:hypothetical protein